MPFNSAFLLFQRTYASDFRTAELAAEFFNRIGWKETVDQELIADSISVQLPTRLTGCVNLGLTTDSGIMRALFRAGR